LDIGSGSTDVPLLSELEVPFGQTVLQTFRSYRSLRFHLGRLFYRRFAPNGA
jgi:hypothetical protein